MQPARLVTFTRWQVPPDELAAAVDAAIAAARAAWPEWLAEPVLLDAIAATFDDEDDPVAGIRGLRAADFYLARACAAGRPEAIAALEADYLPIVAVALRAMRAPDDMIKEITQRLRERMLVGDTERGPRIADYAGTGDLRRWLKTSAVHDYLNVQQRRGREVGVEDDQVFDALVEPELDAELAQLKLRYRDQLRAAFSAALETLEPRSRTLLRYQYVDGATVAQICAIYRVHRSTLHRWLAEARAELADRTLAELGARLGADTGDANSIRRLVQSQVEVSLPRLLADR